jgi:hypothetical protein
MKPISTFAGGLALVITLSAGVGWAQGTAFTYQGRLNSSPDGSGSSGHFDFAFALYGTNSGGSMYAGPVTNFGVGVSNGLFTTTVDFGPGVFAGAGLWLDMAVRTNGAGPFTGLAPRQALTPTPYAIMATSASNLLGTLPAGQLTGTLPSSALAGTYSGPVTFNNGADIFDGTFIGNFLGANFTGGNFTGQFFGDGSGLANLKPQGVAWLASNQVFTAQNIFMKPISIGNPNPLPIFAVDILADQANVRLQTTNSGNGAVLELRNTTTNYWEYIGAINFNNPVGNYPGQIGYFSYPAYPGNDYFAFRINGLDSSFNLYGDSNGYGTVSLVSGYYNYASYYYSGDVIAGGGGPGTPNTIYSGGFDFIGSGLSNQISAYPWPASYSFIGSGRGNQIFSDYSGILGGYHNLIQTNSPESTIGSGAYNSILGLSYQSAIAGGNANSIQTSSPYSFIGSGLGNTVQTNSWVSTIGGGYQNIILANGGGATIGGGFLNTNSGAQSTIGGGSYNSAIGGDGMTIGGGSYNSVGDSGGTVGGGAFNHANGYNSTVPGGVGNVAGGQNTFAAGTDAQAVHDGSFVLTDLQFSNFYSTTTNQLSARFTGGVRFVTAGAGMTLDGAPVLTTGLNGSLGAGLLAGNYTNTVIFTNAGNVFAGNGGGLSNVNAALLNGLPASAFAPAASSTNYIQNQSLGLQNASFQITGNGSVGGAMSASTLIANNAQLSGALTSTNVTTGTARVSGLFRSGSETNTTDAPLSPGLVIRRINSLANSVSNVIARTDVLTLERDGTNPGLLIRYPAAVSAQTINCIAMTSAGASIFVHTNLNGPGVAGTIQLLTSAQRAVHAQISFGNTLNAGHVTQVVIDRYDDNGVGTGDNFWVGTLSSTYNQ